MTAQPNERQSCGARPGQRCACWHTQDIEWRRNDPLADLPAAQPWRPDDKEPRP